MEFCGNRLYSVDIQKILDLHRHQAPFLRIGGDGALDKAVGRDGEREGKAQPYRLKDPGIRPGELPLAKEVC